MRRCVPLFCCLGIAAICPCCRRRKIFNLPFFSGLLERGFGSPSHAYIEFIEMDSDKVLVPGELEKEAAAIVAHCSQQIAKGITCCVSTKRVVLTLPDDTPEAALVRSVAISDALQSCVGRLTASPAFVVAKGGITSSDVGVKALRVKCAKVLGQIRPGIPVWQTGAESLFPGTPYIIFPGNVGEVPTLREAVEILLG